MPAVALRSRARARCFTVAAIAVVACALIGAAAFGAPSKRIVVTDPAGDVNGALDLTRASLQRAPDGRLRAVLRFAGEVTGQTLLASSGPPGSACLRIWTAAGTDPRAMRPDRLVCATARSQDELRAGVYEVTGPGLPKRAADASVKVSASRQIMVLRFAQSSIGRPKRIRFAIESTRPGCERASCIDTVPDKGRTRIFRLR
jgi:hypothetical protein